MSSTSLMDVRHLVHHFHPGAGLLWPRSSSTVHAVDDVSFSLARSETLGIVGESGCGKSTLVRCLVRLLAPTAGTISFDGNEITRIGGKALRSLRGEVQMVFQDPRASLNPRRRIGDIVAAAVRVGGDHDIAGRTSELLTVVGLDPRISSRYPHELSGGQRQRVGVARALGVRPRLIVLDEPVSSLDVSVQAQLVNLLDDLQEEFDLSYIFVAHDLAVVRHVSDRIAVMYLGKIVELASADGLFAAPRHPYSAALIAAIPIPEARHGLPRRRDALMGEPPSPIRPPSGCRFHPRCPRASAICVREEPPLVEYDDGQLAACHHPLNADLAEIVRASRSPLSPAAASASLPIVAQEGASR